MAARRLLSIASLAAAGAAIAVAVALAGGGPAPGPGAGEPRPATRTLALRPLVAPGARFMRDRAHALSVAVPAGWRRARKSLTPRLAPPQSSILALASFDPAARPRRGCGWWPDMPQVRLGPRDALLHVEEQLDAQPGDLPRRPHRFRLREQLRRPGVDELVASVFPWRCLNRPGIAGLRESFRAHGRLLHLTAFAGERTSRRVRRELLGVAASLRFGPPAPLAVTVRPPSGDPDTRFRLEIEASHRSGRRGRHFRGYWASVHGPLRTACVIEHDAFFSYGPPGARLHAELDPSRTKGGRWCRGRFRGVLRYRDWDYTRPAGRFTFTVR